MIQDAEILAILKLNTIDNNIVPEYFWVLHKSSVAMHCTHYKSHIPLALLRWGICFTFVISANVGFDNCTSSPLSCWFKLILCLMVFWFLLAAYFCFTIFVSQVVSVKNMSLSESWKHVLLLWCVLRLWLKVSVRAFWHKSCSTFDSSVFILFCLLVCVFTRCARTYC